MKYPRTRPIAAILTLASWFSFNALADDATESLFELLDRGGCDPESLVDTRWRISTGPVGTHGELRFDDRLSFTALDTPNGVSKRVPVQVMRNGNLWASEDGWFGRCVSNGTTSQYVISGTVDVDGCLHELAIGRLDHTDYLSRRIEIVFQDAGPGKNGTCDHYVIMHPGHAHGDED